MAEGLKQQAFKGVFWRIIETGGKQIVQLIISVILARLIIPSQFGVIAMLVVFISIANVFVDSGFSTALLRKTDRTQQDCNSVFYFNVLIGIISYFILFFCAPFVADFYGMEELKPVLRVVSLSIITSSLSGVQNTLFLSDLKFKILAKYNIISLIVSGSVGIIMAYYDFQVWALVTQTLVSAVFMTSVLWIKSDWRPTMNFSFEALKKFFPFGSRLLASGLLNTLYGSIYPVVIGKVYKASDLAFYSRATNLTGITSSTPTGVLQSVTFPTLCKLQTDEDRLRKGYRRVIKISAFVVFPLCLGVGAISYPLINVLFTDKWIFSAALLQIIVFGGMWYPIHAINLSLLQIKGRSDLFFRLEVIKKILCVVIIFCTFPFGLKAMCYGEILGSLICLSINTFYTGKLIDVGFIKQLRDLCPILLLSLVMFICCKTLTIFLGNGMLSLIMGLMTGVIIYGGGALLFKFPEVKELKNWNK